MDECDLVVINVEPNSVANMSLIGERRAFAEQVFFENNKTVISTKMSFGESSLFRTTTLFLMQNYSIQTCILWL